MLQALDSGHTCSGRVTAGLRDRRGAYFSLGALVTACVCRSQAATWQGWVALSTCVGSWSGRGDCPSLLTVTSLVVLRLRTHYLLVASPHQTVLHGALLAES